jgi:hybrid cluster-associated redox disulfide protein
MAEKKQPDAKPFVTKEMLLGELVAKHPRAAVILLQYGLHCVGCHISYYETIEQGALAHGVPPQMIAKMLDDINAFIADGTRKESL